MGKKAVKKDPSMLKYVPDHFKMGSSEDEKKETEKLWK